MTDTVEKGFWEGSLSNIDSKPLSNAQDRFKISVFSIRLLRVGGTLPTFSTASTELRYGMPLTGGILHSQSLEDKSMGAM
jgi:hypothetical protein